MTGSCLQPTRFPNVLEYLRLKGVVVDEALDRILAANRTSYDELLHNSMRYSLLSGGKRIRPILTIAVSELLGTSAERALPAACATELIHCASLMLDDLPCMDNTVSRRGRDTNHLVFGEDVTTLSAIQLLTLAYQSLLRYAPGDFPLAYSLLRGVDDAIGADGLIGGQIGDLHPEQLPGDYSVFHKVYERKTGRLFSFAVESGARIGGASATEFACLSTYARNLGIAFQICDDLLDLRGDPRLIGKEVGKDQGKRTPLRSVGPECALGMARGLIESAVDELRTFGEKGRFLAELPGFLLSQVPGIEELPAPTVRETAANPVLTKSAGVGSQC